MRRFSKLSKSLIWHRVPIIPVLDFTTLLARPRSKLASPLWASRAALYPYARVALLEGLRLLGIGAGDNVLVPSFICSAAIAPFNALGVEVRYYEVDDELQPRFDTALRALNSRTKAFLGVHYFGFPQDIEAIRGFCNSHELYYVEDNSHGFLSAHRHSPLGTFGDIAILSQRKTLALPHGGALVVNASSLSHKVPPTSGYSRDHKASIVKFILQNLILNLEIFPSIRGLDVLAFAKKFTQLGQAGDLEANLDDCMEPYSKFATWILFRTDFEKEKLHRRRTYLFWQDVFARSALQSSPVFKDLPEGVIPWAFPVRVHKRKEFIHNLRRQGIECFAWPNPPSSAPRTQLNQEIVLIPFNRYPLMPYPSPSEGTL
jgi:perosamine synthetase